MSYIVALFLCMNVTFIAVDARPGVSFVEGVFWFMALSTSVKFDYLMRKD